MDQGNRDKIKATFLGRSVVGAKRFIGRVVTAITTLVYYIRTNLDHAGGELEINDKSHQNAEGRGLFSIFREVVDIISSNGQKDIRVTYHNTLYNENTIDNMWTYYFDPIDNQTKEKFTLFFTERPYKDPLSTEKSSHLQLFNKVISTRIKVREDIVNKADLFFKNNLSGKKLIGVHYRGTDIQITIDSHSDIFKKTALEKYFIEIDFMLKNGYESIFLATDEENILRRFIERYGSKVVFYPSKRSIDGRAVHKMNIDRRQNGEDVIVEMLIMSKADFLIHGCSNIPTVAKYFNPSLLSKNLDVINKHNSA